MFENHLQGGVLLAFYNLFDHAFIFLQDLFIVHQGQHPVIILNGMKFNDLKMVVDFMYRGETRVCSQNLLVNLLE